MAIAGRAPEEEGALLKPAVGSARDRHPARRGRPRPRRVAVGTFDGVHLGHREVIQGADTVLTFDPHPSMVVAPGGAPKLLTTLERKAELIAALGSRSSS